MTNLEVFVAAWNAHRGSLPAVYWPVNEARTRRFFSALREEADIKVWIYAFQMKAADPYWQQKGYGLDNLVRPANRGAYLDAARQGYKPDSLAAGATLPAAGELKATPATEAWLKQCEDMRRADDLSTSS